MEKFPGFDSENKIAASEPNHEEVYENTHYEVNPQLKRVTKNADVSYWGDGMKHERHTDIYKDDKGKKWYELKKVPVRQMAVSLLAQPLFNAATIIKLQKKGIIGKVIEKANPELYERVRKYIDKPRYLSKELPPEEVTPKRELEQIADIMIYQRLFYDTDKIYEKGHNVTSDRKSYSLYDYDHTTLAAYKSQDYEHVENFITKIPIISPDAMRTMSSYGMLLSLPGEFGDRKIPIQLLSAIIKKLEEVENFFKGDEGRTFFKAVLDKTGFIKTNVEEGKLSSPADKDPDMYYKGFVALISLIAKRLLIDIEKNKDNFTSVDESIVMENYDHGKVNYVKDDDGNIDWEKTDYWKIPPPPRQSPPPDQEYILSECDKAKQKLLVISTAFET